MTKAVFLDRDGTINREVDFLRRVEDVRLLPGVAEGMRALKAAGFMLVVVSNQSGLARGIFDEGQLALVQLEIKRQLAEYGASWDAVYFCPHHPSEGVVEELVLDCHCRKPKPGLVLMAAEEMNISLADSFLIGDRLRDVACGLAAGVKSVLVQSGRHLDDGRPRGGYETPDLVAADFTGAVNWILKVAGINS